MEGTKTEFMQWLDGELEKDPEFRQRVEAGLNEMRIEQDLIALREARGLSQSELARRIGVSQPLIARLEAGRLKNMTVKTLARYAAGLGASVRIALVKDEQAKASKSGRKVYRKKVVSIKAAARARAS